MTANVKNVALHVCVVFGSVFGTTLAATGYSTSKAAVVAGVSSASAAALHYLAGLIPQTPAAPAKAPAPPA